MNTKKKSSFFENYFNFGLNGWLIIIYCLVMFWFYVGFSNDGANITAPAMAEKLNVPHGTVMNVNAMAGIVGVLFFIAVGQINKRFGPRRVSGCLMILAGLAYICMGRSTSLIQYGIFICIVIGTSMSAGYISGGLLVAKWFPKKKGVVMGYTTMGHNLASAFYVPVIAFYVGKFGITNGVVVPAIGAIILGVLGLILVRNTPEERGMLPDNVSREVYEEEYFTDEVTESMWTTKKLLRTKELWLAAITTGFFQICSVGVMSQLVVRNVSLGFTQESAIQTMTIVALIGVFGSWLIGVFDEKFGTKKTMMGFGIWYALALVANITETKIGIYLSILMIGIGIGGSANFTTSLPTSIFGRHEFDKVNSVIFPIQGAITSLTFAVNGVVLNLTGNLRMAYVVFACVALANVVLVSRVDEYRFNKDMKVEFAHDAES